MVEDPPLSLRDRARFALLDRESAERERLARLARDLAAERLGVSEIELGQVDPKAHKIEFAADGLKFRLTVVARDKKTGSNPDIDGIHLEEDLELHMRRESYWDSVHELADVGASMRKAGLIDTEEAIEWPST